MSDLDLSFIGIDYEVQHIEAVIICTIIAVALAFVTANVGIRDADEHFDKCQEKFPDDYQDKCPNLKSKWVLLKFIAIPLSLLLSIFIVPHIANR